MNLKDLISDLGGRRSLAMGSILIGCTYVATDHYVDGIEAWRAQIDNRIIILERRQQSDDTWRIQGARFTGEQSAEINRRLQHIELRLEQPAAVGNIEVIRRLERLEREVDERKKYLRQNGQ